MIDELMYRGGVTLDIEQRARWYELRANEMFDEYDRTGNYEYKVIAREYAKLAKFLRKGVTK